MTLSMISTKKQKQKKKQLKKSCEVPSTVASTIATSTYYAGVHKLLHGTFAFVTWWGDK